MSGIGASIGKGTNVDAAASSAGWLTGARMTALLPCSHPNRLSATAVPMSSTAAMRVVLGVATAGYKNRVKSAVMMNPPPRAPYSGIALGVTRFRDHDRLTDRDDAGSAALSRTQGVWHRPGRRWRPVIPHGGTIGRVDRTPPWCAAGRSKESPGAMKRLSSLSRVQWPANCRLVDV